MFESLKEKEVESGYGRDLTWETVVARKGTGFVRVVAQERVSYGPRGGGASSGIDTETPITEAEYLEVAHGKPILDTAAALQGLKDQKAAIAAGYAREAELREKRAPLYERLKAITPKCRNCDRPMSLTKKASRQFWACSMYPRNCEGGFENLTAEVRRILAEIEQIGS